MLVDCLGLDWKKEKTPGEKFSQILISRITWRILDFWCLRASVDEVWINNMNRELMSKMHVISRQITHHSSAVSRSKVSTFI
jgi:hypothetical protein